MAGSNSHIHTEGKEKDHSSLGSLRIQSEKERKEKERERERERGLSDLFRLESGKTKSERTRNCDFDTWKKSDALHTMLYSIRSSIPHIQTHFGWPMQFYWTHSWTWKTTVCVTYHPFVPTSKLSCQVRKELSSISLRVFVNSYFLSVLSLSLSLSLSLLFPSVSIMATKWTWIDAEDENFIDWVSTLHLDYFSSSSLMSFRTFLASPASFSLSP